ncbi:MAG: DUF3311 domain-containing protein [Candidatus Eremiobacteraeota bacterium]|nr:DUF3311 domain-containing protein [Candidatus Eremiobacteraeota bacterium]
MRTAPPSGRLWLRVLLAAIPIAALTIAVPLVNHVEPRILGLPFVLCWIIGWVLLTPAFLWTIGRLERHW